MLARSRSVSELLRAFKDQETTREPSTHPMTTKLPLFFGLELGSLAKYTDDFSSRDSPNHDARRMSVDILRHNASSHVYPRISVRPSNMNFHLYISEGVTRRRGRRGSRLGVGYVGVHNGHGAVALGRLRNATTHSIIDFHFRHGEKIEGTKTFKRNRACGE